MTSSSSQPLFVFLQVFEWEGGIQSYVKDVLRAYAGLNQGGATVLLLRDGPDCPNPLRDTDLAFCYLKSAQPMVGRLRLALALAWRLLRSQPPVVICGHINLAPLVRWLCDRTGTPYVVMTYGKEVWRPLPPRQQAALAAAQQVWTISRYSGDQMAQANALDPSRIARLPCIVSGDTFTPGPAPPRLVAQYGLGGARVLMTVARLWSGDIYKGVDVTIRALPAIAQAHPTVKYLVIGRGDDQPRLAQLAEDLGVADRVVFAGYVADDALVDHYRLADAYVMPSQEGFGIVYLEAMACGIPVLSGDDDGSADPLQSGQVGWRVPHRDPDAVAKACIEILSGNDRRCEGDWLRSQTLAHFGPDALKAQLNQLLSPFMPPADTQPPQP